MREVYFLNGKKDEPMSIPVRRYTNADFTIWSDSSCLIASDKHLISHALESVLAELTSSERVIQRKIDDFVNTFNHFYPISEHEIAQFCRQLHDNTPQYHTTQLIQFVSVRNTVTTHVTKNYDDIIACLQRSFTFNPNDFNFSVYNEVLCTSLEYAVKNSRRNKPVIMITGSPMNTECQHLISMATQRGVKIHVLFVTNDNGRQADMAFYEQIAKASHGQLFKLVRGFTTEMQLEDFFRRIIRATSDVNTGYTDNVYQYLAN
jgi:hypothetical protein